MKADQEIRANTSDLPVRLFDNPAFSVPPPLSQSTIAVVTTAGLHARGDQGWVRGDQGFRVLSSSGRDFMCGHLSPNFDRSGMVRDLNVVLPLDRLGEMAAAGVIGSVSPLHLSFQGAQAVEMDAIRQETGPAAGALLLEQGVDVVLLTPV